jgi:hypothetical protein
MKAPARNYTGLTTFGNKTEALFPKIAPPGPPEPYRRSQTRKSFWYPDVSNRSDQKSNSINPDDSANPDTIFAFSTKTASAGFHLQSTNV